MIESIEQGRKEDGNRSIADKIIKRLHDLDKDVENNYGRWAWELLQNAKDSIAEFTGRSVSVQIELFEEKVEFRHNGIHFTEQDVRGIINQISSKEIEDGQYTKKTGRFGTGFLTTHLLSRLIRVKGIVETKDKEYYTFEFPLDRDGKTTSQLIPKIENAWAQFHQSANKIDANYDQSEFNTSFCYHLESNEQKEIAKLGIAEFINLIPFVLVFVPSIECVEIIDHTLGTNIIFENYEESLDGFTLSISKIENKEKTDITVLYASDEKVCIATLIEKSEKGYSFKSIKDIPKLFCDFPLIGTEKFHFPVVVNSFFFNPQSERDGIWLKGSEDKEVEENQDILKRAVKLFKNILSNISEKPFYNIFNIAETRLPVTNDKYFDESWFIDNIQNPIREVIFNSKIVEMEGEGLEKQVIRNLRFPLKSYSKTEQINFWSFTYDLSPTLVCKKDHIHEWCQLSWAEWNSQTYSSLISDLENLENIEMLGFVLEKTSDETFDWLNSFGAFILEDESNLALFEKSKIVPNKYGFFNKRGVLFIDEIKDDELIDILRLLGKDWKHILLNDHVEFGQYLKKEKKDIAAEITEILKRPTDNEDDYKMAISLMSEWFENNQNIGKELFHELHRKRAELFMNTIVDKESLYKVMRSKTDLAKLSKVAQALDDNPKLLDDIQKSEELSNLLKEFNASDVTELKSMLLSAQGLILNQPKVEITKEVLLSLGVTSIEELEDALKDKDLASRFNHTSIPSVEMFIYVQGLIDRAKKNVIEYLKTLPDYDCTDIEELATTVIGGIKKHELSVHIVVRPSDNGEVIIYYSSEKDTLDYENAELWIENGRDKPRHLTLGKILKTTGIKKIPV